MGDNSMAFMVNDSAEKRVAFLESLAKSGKLTWKYIM